MIALVIALVVLLVILAVAPRQTWGTWDDVQAGDVITVDGWGGIVTVEAAGSDDVTLLFPREDGRTYRPTYSRAVLRETSPRVRVEVRP